MKPQEKLSKNCYQIDQNHPHIVLATDPDHSQLEKLVAACPAGLYQQNPDGSLSFDFHGCLECGTCRLLCDEKVLARWQYPSTGYGIVLRFG